MTDQNYDPFDRTRPIDRPAEPVATTERLRMPTAEPTAPSIGAPDPAPSGTAPRSRTGMNLRTGPPQRAAIVVLVGIAVLTLAFLIMIFVNVSSESVIALAVIATPIASMVAAYYAVTLSIHQVGTERADKEKAMATLDSVRENARETDAWAAQMESGLRVALAKLESAGVSTDAVRRAAGTPDDFF
ncbi:hypothetical protein K2F54_00860 [Cryobacterium sp. 1639]|uniref:hypothetical protein n=1 Tax=Cryobacterium inferilacus TaxID=2866629 RepID=UPI001C72F75D|nr:hypothetical protein [Cryobacterium sp. 1639]MBX0298520.1 hypothetical protein [Cryobacterium sp. 1639]